MSSKLSLAWQVARAHTRRISPPQSTVVISLPGVWSQAAPIALAHEATFVEPVCRWSHATRCCRAIALCSPVLAMRSRRQDIVKDISRGRLCMLSTTTTTSIKCGGLNCLDSRQLTHNHVEPLKMPLSLHVSASTTNDVKRNGVQAVIGSSSCDKAIRHAVVLGRNINLQYNINTTYNIN